MSSSWLTWLFALAVSSHMLEEIIWLPAWSQEAGRWHVPVQRGEFTAATLLFLAVFYLSVVDAIKGGPGLYLTAGFAVVMIFNILLPHLGATVAQRRYAPGLATAVAFNLPAASAFLIALSREEHADTGRFLLGTAVALFGALVIWPRLFQLGRWFLHKVG